MTWEEVFAQLSADWQASPANPARMQELLERIGHPERELHFVHIAGTNGKGSASAMLAEILKRSGLRTGRYISPHLSVINERWSVNGEDIRDDTLSELLERLRPAALSMEDKPTKFELLTALGFLYFRQENCRIVVLEVGLGGRLDATNAILVPDCALIMEIGLEHTEILGDTLEKIAFEKGGIIKPGGETVLCHQSEEAAGVIRELCRKRGAGLLETDPESLTELGADLLGQHAGQRFHYRSRRNLRLALLGRYQCRNACAVLDAVDVLIRKGYPISETAIREGLEKVFWPGRFEILSTEPLCVVDGAHNPDGAEALAETVRAYLASRRVIFVMGVMADKDYDEMIRLTAPYAARFIARMPGAERDRALRQQELAERIARQFPGPVETADSAEEGLRLALAAAEEYTAAAAGEPGAQQAAIVCFGSLYQVEEIREALHTIKDAAEGWDSTSVRTTETEKGDGK